MPYQEIERRRYRRNRYSRGGGYGRRYEPQKNTMFDMLVSIIQLSAIRGARTGLTTAQTNLAALTPPQFAAGSTEDKIMKYLVGTSTTGTDGLVNGVIAPALAAEKQAFDGINMAAVIGLLTGMDSGGGGGGTMEVLMFLLILGGGGLNLF